MDEIDKKFADTTKLMFGKQLSTLDEYKEWLQWRLPKSKTVKSCMSNSTITLPCYSFFDAVPAERVVGFTDTQLVADKKITMESGSEPSLSELIDKVRSIAYFVPDFVEGRNINVVDTVVYLDSVNLYNSFDIFTTKNTAYTFSCINSECLFGCYRVVSSKFCIHCYVVINCNLCFEVVNAKGCSNAFFCHNVENVHDSMFCFNTKNKQYAVANVEIGKEHYMLLKKMLLKWIIASIHRDRSVMIDIYNVLCPLEIGRASCRERV